MHVTLLAFVDYRTGPHANIQYYNIQNRIWARIENYSLLDFDSALSLCLKNSHPHGLGLLSAAAPSII
jgi:hypothetical protein